MVVTPAKMQTLFSNAPLTDSVEHVQLRCRCHIHPDAPIVRSKAPGIGVLLPSSVERKGDKHVHQWQSHQGNPPHIQEVQSPIVL